MRLQFGDGRTHRSARFCATLIVLPSLVVGLTSACGTDTKESSGDGGSGNQGQSSPKNAQAYYQLLRSRVEAAKSASDARQAYWDTVCQASKDLDSNFTIAQIDSIDATPPRMEYASFQLQAVKYASGNLGVSPGLLISNDLALDMVRYYNGTETVCDIAARH